MVSPAKKLAFHEALQRWYKTHGRRDLPWRNTSDPYAIYLSEIMLQQTQVKTVLEGYYAPFLKTFPTLAALANADRQAVTKQWEGLGYYTRAANLHKASQACKGVLPQTVEALHALPGIGRNTARAIACFAFGHAVPVMEANVRRILCRVFALRKADEDILWEKAEQLVDTQNPFDYNQAMMDIGALVCTKRNPRCGECPLAGICLGKASAESYPAAKVAKITPIRERIIVALRDKQGYYYLQRRETRFLNGLYGFPEYEPGTKSILHRNRDYSLKATQIIGQIRQTYSHFTLHGIVYLLPVVQTKNTDLHQVTLEGMKLLPLSRADHKIMALLANT